MIIIIVIIIVTITNKCEECEREREEGGKETKRRGNLSNEFRRAGREAFTSCGSL